jgi:Fungal protein kinase
MMLSEVIGLFTKVERYYRDISLNNLIITDSENEDPKGRLADLDLAKELESDQSGARHQTRTMEFMAIEVLKAMAETYCGASLY